MKASGYNLVLRLVCILGIFASSTEAYILRLPCKTIANFSMVRKNVVLQGSVIERIIFTTLQECQSRCMQNNFCKSVNHQMAGKNICELNNETPEETKNEDNIMKKDGWDFLSTDYDNPTIGDKCKMLNPCGKEVLCTDTCECDGYKCNTCKENRTGLQCENTWPDCNSIRKAGITKNGVYLIRTPDDVNSVAPTTFKVYCDLNSASGHGWMVFQRRVDNTTSFNRSWEEYQRGFGDLRGNLWLGLDKIHRLAAPRRRTILRVDLITHDDLNLKLFAEYGIFSVDNEQTNYLLSVKKFDRRSTLNDSFCDKVWYSRLNHDQKMFSTRWHENDSEELLNCAEYYSGGWWFSQCYLNHMNGVYHDPSKIIDCGDKVKSGIYMTWNQLTGHCFGGICWDEMKLRYADD